jgi:peptide/nickel transport system ATP-binding protein
MKAKDLLEIRPRFQMVFQDSSSALNPRKSVAKIMAKPLTITSQKSKIQRDHLVREMGEQVGLDPGLFGLRPHHFSGGQCQRIQIARALITQPELLVCDEPVSSLDVSIQAQILNLLERLRKQYQLTMLFISHDLAVIKNVSDRVAVMYLGKICEIASCETLFSHPAHPYTMALLSSVPETDPTKPPKKLKLLGGELPSPMTPPSGCRFRTRCPEARERCAADEPLQREISAGHIVACHFST